MAEEFPMFEDIEDMDFPSESWAASDHDDDMSSSNLGSILDSLFGLSMQRDEEYGHASEEGELNLLGLPPEILSSIFTCLHASDDRSSFRLASKGICSALDDSLKSIRISPALVPESSVAYYNLSPTWCTATKKLVISNAIDDGGLWNQWGRNRQGSGPILLFLLMLGPRLTSLTHLKLDGVGEFFLEAILAVTNLGMASRISHLAIKKQMLERANMTSFWLSIDKLGQLVSLSLSGWMLDEVDLAGLEKLTRLQSLHIAHTSNLPEIGLHCLSTLTSLKHLVLEGLEYSSPIENEFNGLSNLKSLETLRFITVGALPEEVQSIASGLTSLRHFEISHHHDQELLNPIRDLIHSNKDIDTLTLTHFELSPFLLRPLSLLPRLTNLSLGRCSAIKEKVPFLLQSVTHLTLRFLYELGPLPNQDQQGGSRAKLADICPNLICLNLTTKAGEGSSGCQVLFNEQAPLTALTSLTALASLLAYPELVRGCPQIKSLSLDCSQGLLMPPPQNHGIADLILQPGLALVEVGQQEDMAGGGAPAVNVPVEEEEAPVPPDDEQNDPAELAPLPLLPMPILPFYQQPSWLESLILFPHLKSLTLSECWSIAVDGAVALADALEKVQLRELSLSSVSVEFLERGIERMTSRKESFNNLRILRLSSSSPARLSAKSLARILNNIPTLDEMHLGGFAVPHFLREQYRKVSMRSRTGSRERTSGTEIFIEASSDSSF